MPRWKITIKSNDQRTKKAGKTKNEIALHWVMIWPVIAPYRLTLFPTTHDRLVPYDFFKPVPCVIFDLPGGRLTEHSFFENKTNLY